jgi:hypothetical protein
VENNGFRQTYLDELPCLVEYTDNNKHNCKHKGVNELLDIKHIIEKHNINDEDYIIKLTGRYCLLDKSFIELTCEKKFDAYVKFFNVCTHKFMPYDCVLGLFSIKCKYIKKFDYSTDKSKISPEVEFAKYIKSNVSNICEVEKLNLEYCCADNLRKLIV